MNNTMLFCWRCLLFSFNLWTLTLGSQPELKLSKTVNILAPRRWRKPACLVDRRRLSGLRSVRGHQGCLSQQRVTPVPSQLYDPSLPPPPRQVYRQARSVFSDLSQKEGEQEGAWHLQFNYTECPSQHTGATCAVLDRNKFWYYVTLHKYC